MRESGTLVSSLWRFSALWREVWSGVLAGELPFWQHTLGGGSPLLGSFRFGALYPGNALFLLGPTAWAGSLYFAIHLWFGGEGLRRWILRLQGDVFVAGWGAIFGQALFCGAGLWAQPSDFAVLVWLIWACVLLSHASEWVAYLPIWMIALAGQPSAVIAAWLILWTSQTRHNYLGGRILFSLTVFAPVVLPTFFNAWHAWSNVESLSPSLNWLSSISRACGMDPASLVLLVTTSVLLSVVIKKTEKVAFYIKLHPMLLILLGSILLGLGLGSAKNLVDLSPEIYGKIRMQARQDRVDFGSLGFSQKETYFALSAKGVRFLNSPDSLAVGPLPKLAPRIRSPLPEADNLRSVADVSLTLNGDDAQSQWTHWASPIGGAFVSAAENRAGRSVATMTQRLFERALSLEAAPLLLTKTAGATWTLLETKLVPNGIDVTLPHRHGGGWIFASANAIPGWTFWTEGSRAPVYVAETALIAAPVLAGVMRARFRYISHGFWLGWFVCALALVDRFLRIHRKTRD